MDDGGIELHWMIRGDLHPAAAVVLEDAVCFDERLTDEQLQASADRLGVRLDSLAPLDAP